MLINGKQIIISAAFWPQQKLYWSELVERLKTPARSTKTLEEYLSTPKSKQDELRDVGEFLKAHGFRAVFYKRNESLIQL